MTYHSKILLIVAALFGAVSVALAAIGAHGLHDMLVQTQRLTTFNKAVDYSTTGALALLAIVVLQQLFPASKYFISGYLIAIGTLLFSGSLFIYVLADYRPITAITPMGGTLLIIAWLSIALFTVRNKTPNQ